MKRKLNRAVALLLAMVLVLSFFPATAFAAGSTTTPDIQAEYNGKPNNGTIQLSGNVKLTEPLYFDQPKVVTILGPAEITVADKTQWTSSDTSDPRVEPYSTMIYISNGASIVLGPGVNISGANTTQCISVNNATLWMEGNIIQNGYIKNSRKGAGISLENQSHLWVKNDEGTTKTIFRNNVADGTTGTAGGALYVTGGSSAQINGASFDSNSANSGGAVYAYDSHVVCYRCDFTNNTASQRGGAVHCHGEFLLDKSTMTGNTSGQYGGAVYISAGEGTPNGHTTFYDTHIVGNRSNGTGGGVYIAGKAQAFVGGSTKVTGNSSSAGDDNIFLNNAEPVNDDMVRRESTMLIAYTDLTCGEGELGVSTGNPDEEKVLVYGMTTEDWLSNSIVFDGYTFPKSFDLSGNEAAQSKFKYDGKYWGLEVAKDEGDKPLNMMWLKSTGATPGTGPVTVFNYNLPGVDTLTYTDKKVNDTIPLPGVKTGSPPPGVSYTFDGWYTEAEGGDLAPDPVVVKDGTTVYYAHWDVEVDQDHGDEIIGDGDMYLVYFNLNYSGGGITTAYITGGTFSFDVEYHVVFDDPEADPPDGWRTTTVEVTIPFGMPANPVRTGYKFEGWSESATGGGTVGNNFFPTKKVTTLFGKWTPLNYTLTWNANGGTGGTTTQQKYDETVAPPGTAPTRTGYIFDGWYLDKNCTTPLTSGTLVTGAATFYAKWKAVEHTITWNTDYTGGSITTTQQDYDEQLAVLTAPVREGYTFAGWYTQQGGRGTRAEGYGKVRGDVTFYAYWTQNVMSYTVDVEWDDESDNDAVRPESVTVELLQNGISTGLTHTFTAADKSDAKGDKWSHTFTNLAKTDVVSNAYVYSVAVTSSVSSEYTYAADFTSNAYAGYILMTHELITTDIDVYLAWADESNNDGYRPSTVNLRLLANGQPIDDAETYLAIAGSGDTWTYTFDAVQKYYTTAAGVKGQEIKYTLVVTPTNAGELDEYAIDYHDYTVTLTHAKDTVSKTVMVQWVDNNDQDNKRPVSMVVQLYADNAPVQGKFVTLSAANKWSYTWADLPEYTAGGRRVVYSAYVSSTLVDYVAKTTEMTIEMTYTPSSTGISAFVTWTDENDADGLRPDYITAELVADGVPTGDKQVLTGANGWMTTWNNYPIYKDGDRIEYTFRIDPVPVGYTAEYFGVYDTSGLSAVLTHVRQRQGFEAKIVWNDRGNISGDRLAKVELMLYADGVAQEDKTAWLDESMGWTYTFENLPVYRDNGTEIKYSVYVSSSRGKYQANTDGMVVTMNLAVEYVDVPLDIIWDDKNNADGLRPDFVAVTLKADGELTKYQRAATVANGWSVVFAGMVKYGYGDDGRGAAINYSAEVTVPVGYQVQYIGTTAVLSMASTTANYPATVTWRDNDDQYGVRPQRVTLTLWADYLDGNGPVLTGRTLRAYAADEWAAEFTDLPVYKDGRLIMYSISVSGDIADYMPSYDGMDVLLTHKGYDPGGVKTDYTATLVWRDNRNANNSRNYGAVLTLYADGVASKTYTLTENDVSGSDYTWTHTFTGLPTKQDGQTITYTIGVTTDENYVAEVEDHTIILTNVANLTILVQWGDDSNSAGLRPMTLTLDLYADGVKTENTLAQEGGHMETWRYEFTQLLVWSTAQTDRAIQYAWLLPVGETSDLNANGYAIRYNSYQQTEVNGEVVYVVNIDREADYADYTAAITWADDKDRDGLRPEMVTAKLLADYSDGNGPVETGRTAELTGGDEAEVWAATLNLPVWANQKAIVYTLRLEAPEGYELTASDTEPAATLAHAPEMVDVAASVVWDDDSNDGGLTRFDLTAELLIDGGPTRLVGGLNAENGYSQSWGEMYVHHDHGTAYDYSFHFTGNKMPEDYEITTEGWVATVRRFGFNIAGTVRDNIGTPVHDAMVTLYDSEKQAVAQTSTDAEGEYTFSGVPKGDYVVRAAKDLSAYSSGSAEVSIVKADLVNVDIVLVHDPDGGGDDYTYTATGTVVDSNGKPAAGAQVNIWTVGGTLAATVTAGVDGAFSVRGLPNGTYQISVVYTYEGQDYTATGTAFTVFNGNAVVPPIAVQVPKPEEPGPEPCVVSGRVVDEIDKALQDILVTLYAEDGSLTAAATTGQDGTYSIEGVPDGTYKVLYHMAGTVVAHQEITIQGEAEYPIPDVEIDTTAKPGYGTLSGVVLDEEGYPVKGAEVYVYDKASGEQVAYIVTGESGAYEFKLPEGTYTVVIKRPFDNVTEGNIPVDDNAVENGTGDPDVTVTADSYTITGYVFDEEGQPMEGVTVYLYGEDPDAEGEYIRLTETTTDGDGCYMFTELAAGKYIVKVASGIGGNGGSTDTEVVVKPNPDQPEGGAITVTTDSYTVTGVVRDEDGEPVKGATVTLADAEGNQAGQVITAEDGVYTFENLPEGIYQLTITYPDSEDLGGGDVDVDDGGHGVVTGYVVSGSVKDQHGNALMGAAVVLTEQATGGQYTAVTDRTGAYQVTTPSGSYTIEAAFGVHTGTGSVTVRDTNVAVGDITITISDGGGEETDPGPGPTPPPDDPDHGGSSGGGSGGGGGGGSSIPTLDADETYILSGTVTDAEGRPVEGADVTATNSKTRETYTDTTGPDGKYAISVPAGKYTISVRYGDAEAGSKVETNVKKDAQADAVQFPAVLGRWVGGYVTGYPDGTFRAERQITRMEVVALISRVAEDFDPAGSYSFAFSDVPGGAWYAANLGYCVQAGLVQGRGNGRFAPGDNITRAEFAAIMARFLGLEGKGESTFADTTGHWAADYIAVLADRKIILGRGDGSFDPEAPITRAEAVTIINRALSRDPDTAVLDRLAANGTIALKDVTKEHWAYHQILEAVFGHYHQK